MSATQPSLQNRHPSVRDLARWLEPNPNLAPGLPSAVADSINLVARSMIDTLPDCAELSAGLRKLLEAKDCFVRAAL